MLQDVLTVRITRFQPRLRNYVSRLYLKFDNPLDWTECTRVLMEAKAHLLEHQEDLRERLGDVLFRHFEDFAPEAPPSEVSTSSINDMVALRVYSKFLAD